MFTSESIVTMYRVVMFRFDPRFSLFVGLFYPWITSPINCHGPDDMI